MDDKVAVFNAADFDATGVRLAAGGDKCLNKVRTFYMRDHLPRSTMTIKTLLDKLSDLKPGVNMDADPLVMGLEVWHLPNFPLKPKRDFMPLTVALAAAGVGRNGRHRRRQERGGITCTFSHHVPTRPLDPPQR